MMQMPMVHNISLERSVIASAMVSATALHELSTRLDDTDFYDEKMGNICKELKKCSAKGYEPDMMMMIPKLGEEYYEVFASVLGGSFGQSVATSDNIVNQCRKIREISTARKLVSKAFNIIASAGSISDHADFVEKAVSELSDISTDHKGGRLVHISSHFGEAIQEFQDVQSGKEVGIRCGIADIDRTTNGFRRGEFIVIAGRPAQGKTSLALSMIKNMMLSQKTVAVFSLEMRASELILKASSMLSSLWGEIPMAVFRGTLPVAEAHAESFAKTMDVMRDSKIYINESGYTTMLDIESESRRFAKRNPIDCIVVDYMSLIGDEFVGGKARHEVMQDYSMRFKKLAKSLKVPVILLSQIKNDAYNKMPTMADLSESSQLSRDADMIYLIWKPIEDDDKRKVVIGAKGRGVAGGRFCTYFSRSTTEFTSMTESDAIQFVSEFSSGGFK